MSSSYGWEIHFSGYTWSSSAGFYFVRNRVQLPHIGTWTTRDDLWRWAGAHLYEYVNGAPVTRTDPAGLIAVPGCVAGAVGSGLGSVFASLTNVALGNKSLCVAVTDAACDAIEGCLTGALGPALNPHSTGGFLGCGGIGLVVGVVTQACKAAGRSICDRLFDCRDEFSWRCFWLDVVQGAADALGSCTIAHVEGLEEPAQELLLAVLFGDIEGIASAYMHC